MSGKSEKTRKRIIELVAPIFNKQGFAGTALSDIEVATGLTKGAIYGNFKNKNELAKACLDYNLSFLQKGVHRAIATSGGCHAQLKALLLFYRHHYDEVANMGGCPLLNTATESDDTLPFLNEKVRASITQWQREIVAILNGGKADGTVRNDVDVDRFSIGFIAMIEGGIMLAKSMNDKNYFLQAVNAVEVLIEKELKIL